MTGANEEFLSLAVQFYEIGLRLQHDIHGVLSKIENVRDESGNIPVSVVDIEIRIRAAVFTIMRLNKVVKEYIISAGRREEAVMNDENRMVTGHVAGHPEEIIDFPADSLPEKQVVVPLVIYVGGERKIVGEAVVKGDLVEAHVSESPNASLLHELIKKDIIRDVSIKFNAPPVTPRLWDGCITWKKSRALPF